MICTGKMLAETDVKSMQGELLGKKESEMGAARTVNGV